MNIIQIVSDTFRRDHLGCYGNDWIRTPSLDRFARIATVFDRAYICSFPTVPARFEFMTGKVAFPTRGWEPMPRDQVTLAERLRERGYVSMGIFDTANLMRQGYNYMKGFDAFEWIRGQEGDEASIDYAESYGSKLGIDPGGPPEKLRSGWEQNIFQHRRSALRRRTERDYFVAQTMQAACDWLERNYKWEKFFLYVDTFDPHEPWDPPEWYVRLYEKNWNGHALDYPKGGHVKGVFTKREIQHIRALYAAEVTLVDKWIGALIEKIEDLGLLDKTMVIFSADHGSLHGEHGIMQKYALYEEVVRIPLMMFVPRLRGNQRQRALVQIPDIAATVMDAAGARLDDIDGQSLLPLLRGEKRLLRRLAPCSRKLTRNAPDYLSVTDGVWSLVFSINNDRGELYHLPDDPKQQKNMLLRKPREARRLLDGFIRFARLHGANEEVVAPLEERARNLWSGKKRT